MKKIITSNTALLSTKTVKHDMLNKEVSTRIMLIGAKCYRN